MINKSELMTRAWEIAEYMVDMYHMNASNRKYAKYSFKYNQLSWTKKDNFKLALKKAWEIMKENAKKAVKSVAKKTGKYIELLSVAIENGLNHGKSWTANGYTVDKNSLNPSWEGENICYVYA